MTNNNTREYTDVFGRTYEEDYDDILRREDAVSEVERLNRMLYDFYKSKDHDNEGE